MPTNFEIGIYWEFVALAAIVAGLYYFVLNIGLVSGAEYLARALFRFAATFQKFCKNSQGLLAPPSLVTVPEVTEPNQKFLPQPKKIAPTPDRNPVETPVPAITRLSHEEQWDRVSNVISDSIETARKVDDIHASAARQLDAVDYEYFKMIDELSSLLPHVGAVALRVTHASKPKSPSKKSVQPAREPASIAA